MRTDTYTKAVLTVIALLLTLIACRQYVTPEPARAEGPFAGLQHAAAQGAYTFFDTRSGELYVYADHDTQYRSSDGDIQYRASGKLIRKYRLSKLGEPLAPEYYSDPK
jgi:hypothetical protein